VRRMDEPIAVLLDETAAVPVAFTWRGRSYVVREVLDHWRERRAWWRTALESGHLDAEDLEEGVWRVAASPGRALHTGVYDLGRSHAWRLLRVAD
jgi:predicted transcriptional regulator